MYYSGNVSDEFILNRFKCSAEKELDISVQGKCLWKVKLKKGRIIKVFFLLALRRGADRIVTLDTQAIRVYSEPHGYSDCQAKSFDLKAKNTAPTMHNAAHR